MIKITVRELNDNHVDKTVVFTDSDGNRCEGALAFARFEQDASSWLIAYTDRDGTRHETIVPVDTPVDVDD